MLVSAGQQASLRRHRVPEVSVSTAKPSTPLCPLVHQRQQVAELVFYKAFGRHPSRQCGPAVRLERFALLQGSALVKFGLDRAVGTGRIAAETADIVGMIKVAQARSQHPL